MTQPPTSPLTLDRVHLVGVGGAGMSGIARILLARGATVSGSDAKESKTLTALRALGARIAVGHDPAVLAGATVVVASTAIRPGDPDLVAAGAAGVPVVPRAAALAALMAGRVGVAVAGTHGKTTTTSMLTVALLACGADPSYAIGGDLNEAGSNAHHGSGRHFVAEADESDGSFLLLAPWAALVTNVEADHLDHYGTAEAVEQSFRDFVTRLAPEGFLVTCADDPGARALAAHARAGGRDVRTYGEAADADLRVTTLASSGPASTAEVSLHGSEIGRLTVGVPGRHNVINAAGALLMGLGLGEPAEALLAGLASFTGVRRRFERKGGASGVEVVDDYAHHPTEIAATLAAARGVVGRGRLIVAFQPHRYSRTLAFGPELGAALGAADVVICLDVYAAGEDPIPGVSGATVAAAVPLPAADVAFEPSWSAVPAAIAARARPGDLVLTLGAGDVTQLGEEILRLLALSGTR